MLIQVEKVIAAQPKGILVWLYTEHAHQFGRLGPNPRSPPVGIRNKTSEPIYKTRMKSMCRKKHYKLCSR